MALKENVAKLLDEQVNKELYSAYLYLAFADYYEERGLKGFANWYMIQVQEEVSHAKILRRYLLDNGAKVTLSAIAAADVALCRRRRASQEGPRPRAVRDRLDQRAATPPPRTPATSAPCSCSTGS